MVIENRCYKYKLPNGHVVDILSGIVEEVFYWLQNDFSAPESGGYILGYCDNKTNNITLEFITVPQKNDIRNKVRFILRDILHFKLLDNYKKKKSYYMGVWHTHPQRSPVPSKVDWEDWYSTLLLDKTGCQYIFFLIFGTVEFKIWAGDIELQEIYELKECNYINGLYVKEG